MSTGGLFSLVVVIPFFRVPNLLVILLFFDVVVFFLNVFIIVIVVESWPLAYVILVNNAITTATTVTTTAKTTTTTTTILVPHACDDALVETVEFQREIMKLGKDNGFKANGGGADGRNKAGGGDEAWQKTILSANVLEK